MIPLYDDVPARHVSLVNYALIAICAIVFLVQLFAPDRGRGLTESYGLVSARITHGNHPLEVSERFQSRTAAGWKTETRQRVMAPSPISPLATLLTCLFLHSGWLHLLGNLWFLAIFGDNVEDRYGHLGYVAFFLLCGLTASVLHLFAAGDSVVPAIGSSGAVGGVLGAYLVLFRNARIVTIAPLGALFAKIVVPAPFFLILWVVLQMAVTTLAQTGATGVAWWAHASGFVMGLTLTWLLRSFGWLHRDYADQIDEHGYY